jgi:hypothetical protein
MSNTQKTTGDSMSVTKGEIQPRFLFGVALIVLLAFSIFTVAAARAEFALQTPSARGPITGEWRIEFTRENPEEVQLTMLRSTGSHAKNWGHGVLVRDLQGLSREEALHSAINVTLRLTREAGVFELAGSFRDGKGTGQWTLTPNEKFVSGMSSRGYANLSDDNLFAAAMANLSISSIDELKAAGYDQLSFDQLIEANIFKITGESIRDLQAAGFDKLPFEKLVEARIFNVDGAFAREIEALGFGKQSFAKLVGMRVHKVSREYADEMRALGFNRLSLDQLIEFKIFKVTPQFIAELKAEGFSSVSPEQVVELRVHHVDIDFIRSVKAKGFPNVTLDELVEMRIFGKAK